MRPQYAVSGVPPASPVQMTPRTKALYAFGESPAKVCRSPPTRVRHVFVREKGGGCSA